MLSSGFITIVISVLRLVFSIAASRADTHYRRPSHTPMALGRRLEAAK